MNVLRRDELAKNFKETMEGRMDEIDPSQAIDWFSLATGFFLGKGETVEDAHLMAVHVYYILH